MSTLVSAVVPRTLAISAEQIEACARGFEVEVSLPAGLDIETDFGVIPCVLNGQPAAFEFTCDREDGEESMCLQLEARASYASFAACAYVAACISILGGGVVRDEDGQEFGGTSLAAWLASIAPPEPETASDELRIEVSVVGPRGNGFLQLELGRVPPGAHLARRLVESIETERVPPRLRAPNSRFVIVVRDACEIVSIEPAPVARKA